MSKFLYETFLIIRIINHANEYEKYVFIRFPQSVRDHIMFVLYTRHTTRFLRFENFPVMPMDFDPAKYEINFTMCLEPTRKDN